MICLVDGAFWDVGLGVTNVSVIDGSVFSAVDIVDWVDGSELVVFSLFKVFVDGVVVVGVDVDGVDIVGVDVEVVDVVVVVVVVGLAVSVEVVSTLAIVEVSKGC